MVFQFLLELNGRIGLELVVEIESRAVPVTPGCTRLVSSKISVSPDVRLS